MPEQKTINAYSAHKFAPSFLNVGELTLSNKNKTFTLNPKKDLTAYELYQINQFVETCKLNYMVQSGVVDRLIEEIHKTGIARHFDIVERECD